VLRSRPCRICRRWFRPHARAGDRQRVCSDEACQRERHRRSCERWRDANDEDERAERVRLRVTLGAAGEAPSARLAWSAVRDAVGVEAAAIIEESVRHAEAWARDAVRAHPIGITRECGVHRERQPRDAIGGTALDP